MTEALKALLAEAIGLSPAAVQVSLRPPLEPQSNQLYDVWAGDRHLIAKEFLKPAEFREAPVREFQALKLLAPLDIAPQPVFFQPLTSSHRPVVVYEFMPGQMWDRHRPTAAELAQLAALWLRMNDVPTENLRPSRGHVQPLHQTAARLRAILETYATWVEAEFAPGQRAVELCFSVMESSDHVVRQLATYDPPFCFCRADARFANVIQRPDGRLGLVDWEDSGLRDPARDLVDIITHPNQEDLLSPDEWQAFLRPYLAGRSELDPHLRDRMHLYMALFPLFWLAMLAREGMRLAAAGQLTGWRVHGLTANQKLRRYLARSLAWPEIDLRAPMETIREVMFFPDE
jgi:aminoglycoside phosphotransferase (APT) family kinase protein